MTERRRFEPFFQREIWQYAITAVYPRYGGRVSMAYAYATAAMELVQALDALNNNWVQCYDNTGCPVEVFARVEPDGSTHLIFHPQDEAGLDLEPEDTDSDPKQGKVLPFLHVTKP